MWTFKVCALLTSIENFPLTLSKGILDKAPLSKYFPSRSGDQVHVTNYGSQFLLLIPMSIYNIRSRSVRTMIFESGKNKLNRSFKYVTSFFDRIQTVKKLKRHSDDSFSISPIVRKLALSA